MTVVATTGLLTPIPPCRADATASIDWLYEDNQQWLQYSFEPNTRPGYDSRVPEASCMSASGKVLAWTGNNEFVLDSGSWSGKYVVVAAARKPLHWYRDHTATTP